MTSSIEASGTFLVWNRNGTPSKSTGLGLGRSVHIPNYNARLDEIRAKNAEVIAINRDSAFAHKAWSEHLGGMKFPLLADMNLEVSKKFGIALEEVGITNRGVFVIDSEGTVAFKHVEAAPPDNTIEVEQVLSELDKAK